VNSVNNDFYHDLGDRWHTATDHPIALLRAENRLRSPWISSFFRSPVKLLDMGCGAGFLSHDMGKLGHDVTGIDLSVQSLEVARQLDTTKKIHYLQSDVTKTPFPDKSFDVICAMDLLEHLENPAALIQEASRLLKAGGLFFFHTFNRNFLSWLIVVKGVEWCVKNTPPHLHVKKLFIKPAELRSMCDHHKMPIQEIHGMNIKIMSKPFFKMVMTGEVPEDLEFVFTKSLSVGYSGFCRKR
jgi:2-polyprenyl-6-hydroxyphenyl methylase/3-demethylubiquinone-9 3-methyltransferase